MSRRGRAVGVLALLISGGLALISSTQNWFLVTLSTAAEPIDVTGADALGLLAPVSLIVLALAGVLAIAALALRYLVAALVVAAAVWMFLLTWPLASEAPVSAVTAAVTDATGLAGADAIAALITSLSTSFWPGATLGVWCLLLLGGVLIATTAHTWRSGGKRFRTDTAGHVSPVDAIDSWDDLSRGTDPTGTER